MSNSFVVAKNPASKSDEWLDLLLPMANRHGLIAGATGTGKTVTLRVLAEGLSRAGVPVFMADVKGDLSGIANPGTPNPKIDERVKQLKIEGFTFAANPAVFWDVAGRRGHPVRATISDMGPLLLGRLLNLNDTQSSVLALTFKVADENGLLLLDLKDLRSMLQHVSEHAAELQTQYGNVSSASVGAIQRGLLALEQQGAAQLFGEPALNLDDLLQTDQNGHGLIHVLSAETLVQNPKTYATLLLWLLSELFEKLPEIGDPEKPKLVFFFDEAHLLFTDTPKILLEKIEQVVRLIRSKGVGVYFVTQNPLDIPETVLGQLGNRVQHALRAFTPKDQKAVKAAAQTFRSNSKLNVESAITELAVGEGLVSFLDDGGIPRPVERAFVVPPHSSLAPMSDDARQQLIRSSVLFGTYENAVDRESAYEKLRSRVEQTMATAAPESPRPTGRPRESMFEAVAKSAARAMASQAGRSLIRGVLGSLMGGTSRRSRRY